MGSFIACGAVSYILMRQQWTWKLKSAALAAAVTTVVLVGLSRVYLGVHGRRTLPADRLPPRSGWPRPRSRTRCSSVCGRVVAGGGAGDPKAEIPDKPVPAPQKA